MFHTISTLHKMESYYSSSNGDHTSTGNLEANETVKSAIVVAASFMQHISNPSRPIYQRVSFESDREATNEWLMKDYFDLLEPRYYEAHFRRWLQICARLFLRIAHDLEREKHCNKEVTQEEGCDLQLYKSLCILGYGNATDINDEYLKMWEKTTRDSMSNSRPMF